MRRQRRRTGRGICSERNWSGPRFDCFNDGSSRRRHRQSVPGASEADRRLAGHNDGQDRMTVPVHIGDHGPGRFIIDTGSHGLLSTDLASQLALSPIETADHRHCRHEIADDRARRACAWPLAVTTCPFCCSTSTSMPTGSSAPTTCRASGSCSTFARNRMDRRRCQEPGGNRRLRDRRHRAAPVRAADHDRGRDRRRSSASRRDRHRRQTPRSATVRCSARWPARQHPATAHAGQRHRAPRSSPTWPCTGSSRSATVTIDNPLDRLRRFAGLRRARSRQAAPR